MPSYIDKIKLPRHLDRRVKLTDEDKRRIIRLYRVNGFGIREIARSYKDKCSRRMIQFILFPERMKVVQERAKEVKRWEAHNNKDERRVAMRKLRIYKRLLLKEGKL